MDKLKIEEWVKKWQVGSIVDEWMSSKKYRKFQAYHPFSTYSDPNNDCFIRGDGKLCGELNQDTDALFNIGREAFNRLPKAKSKEDFDDAFSSYFGFIEYSRAELAMLVGMGIFRVESATGEQIELDWHEFDESQIIAIAWQLFSKNKNQPDTEEQTTIRDVCLWHALREIDNAVIALDIHEGGAVIAAIEASNALANALSIDSGDEKLQKVRRDIAVRGANAKHVKTYEKRKQIIEYWREHIPYNTPIEKAAEWLKDSFPDIAHRTFCRYVSEAKKVAKP